MDWRREDTGYAIAAAAAFAFLIYLLAANFGLVPSPLAPLGGARTAETIQATPVVDIPFLPEAPASLPVKLTKTAEHSTGHVTHVIPDTTTPVVGFVTKTGTQVTLAEPGLVRGVASDAGSGIDKVRVAFVSAAGKTVSEATTSCSGDGHRCTWTVPVPGALGQYSVVAQAIDRAGNARRTDSIDLTVINTGSTVDQVTGVVERVPGALSKTVNGLTNTVGALLGSG